MKYLEVKRLLELHLNAIVPSMAAHTLFENGAYAPRGGTAHQVVNILWNDPAPLGAQLGLRQARLRGIFHVQLNYPTSAGAAPALERAQLVESQFRRGTTLRSVDGKAKVVIDLDPALRGGREEGAFYSVPVSISFYADVSE